MAPVVMAVASVVGVGLQFFGQQKAAAAQKKQNRIQQMQNRLRAAAEKRKILREARLKRAEYLAQFGATGAGFGSSGMAGAGAIGNASANNITSVNQQTALGNQQLSAQNAESTGNMISSLGGGVISGANSINNIMSSGASLA